MDDKGEVLLQLFKKSKSRKGIKTFLEPKFFSLLFLIFIIIIYEFCGTL